MTKLHGRTVLLWAKRLLLYLCGLFCIASGLAFAAKSGLGVSPVSAPANAAYLIDLDISPSGSLKLGTWTFLNFCFYVLIQILLLKKDFRPIQLLQIAVSFLFGFMVNLSTSLLAGLPAPSSYAMRMLYLLVNVPLVAAGIMLYLTPELLPTPGEGMSIAVSKRFGLPLHTAVTIFHCSAVSVAAVISLVHFHRLEGVREGTVICAMLTGVTMRQLQKLFQRPLNRFAERQVGEAR